MAITLNQLEVLRDLFTESDDDFLLDHVSIQIAEPDAGRLIVVAIRDVNEQDYEQMKIDVEDPGGQ